MSEWEHAKDLVERVARILPEHRMAIEHGDDEFWSHCICDPTTPYVCHDGPDVPDATRDRDFYVTSSQIFYEHVAEYVADCALDAGWLSPGQQLAKAQPYNFDAQDFPPATDSAAT